MDRPLRILVIDNLDSFTFTLVDYLRAAGARVAVERSNALSVGAALDGGHDAFLISPGPGRPEDAGISVPLARACMEQRRPLLGVCLGHQAIGIAAGLSVEKTLPVHGKVAAITHDGEGVFAGLPCPMQAVRYHSLAVARAHGAVEANAWTADGVIMGLRHRAAPVHGVQFHPESIGSEHGHAMLRNFLAQVGRRFADA